MTMNQPTAVAQSAAIEGMTFEALVHELESVAQAMDNGNIGIEEATSMYARASALHVAARQRLAEVTARVESLRGGDS
jgi:exodeoxyribonuclease VII small subunit